MALSYTQRHALIRSTAYLGRIEVALVRYAVYLRNNDTKEGLGNWAAAILNDDAARAQWVQRIKWYVLENVAASGALTAEGDSSVSDDAIQGQVEAQVQAQAQPTEAA